MSTTAAAFTGLVVLGLAGALPVVVGVGLRWVTLPLAPLAGAVLASLAATAYVALGLSFMTWFVALAVLGAVAAGAWWLWGPTLGLGRTDGKLGVSEGDLEETVRHPRDHRVALAGAVGALIVGVTCVASLRGIRTPTVGFDARALWVMRPGWFLQSHQQLLVDLKVRGLVLTQSAYPPLVSAASAIAWKVTGVHTARLGVVVTAALNGCALAVAAFAVADVGRRAAIGLSGRRAAIGLSGRRAAIGLSGRRAAHAASAPTPWTPLVAGVVVAALLVLVAAGVTEPFLTNGYADPIWSLAAVGAVAWGLQSPRERSAQSIAVVLVLVAGGAKDEGFVTAVAIIALIAVRSLAGVVADHGWRAPLSRLAAPVGLAGLELVIIGWWPELMQVIGARGASSTFTIQSDLTSRTTAVVHGMSPYLHVLVLAVPVAIAGGVVLSGVRRRTDTGNDLWAWAALACGLVAVAGALITGQGAIGPWILSTVHRITEFPTLAAWWIVGTWGVVAATALVEGNHRVESTSGEATPVGDAPAVAQAKVSA